ncbi:MAG TPA: hypothetical protein VNZ58_01920 [Thermomicrobiales bacterium]|nr:hypothetical protein [Thermomicrobiales bacterium]
MNISNAVDRRWHRVSGLLVWWKSSRSDEWIELVAVLLLASASLAAAWCGYQAAAWSGLQSTLYSQSASVQKQAIDTSTQAFLFELADRQLFNDYAAAYTNDDQILMDFYQRQFSHRLRPAVDAWIATEPLDNPAAPGTPFDLPEYIVPEKDAATSLRAKAEELFNRGTHANEQSGEYVLNTVYLATVLFLAGISTKIKGKPARALIEAIGVILLGYGILHIVALPMS